MLAWKRGDLMGALARLKVAFAVTAAVAIVIAVMAWGRDVFGALGLALAAWLATAVAVEFAERIGVGKVPASAWWRRAKGLPRATWGMSLAHLGLAVSIAGMTASTLWQSEEIRIMRPGETATVGGYAYTFEGAGPVDGPNYDATRGRFTVATAEGEPIATLQPEKRRYVVSGRETTEAAIRTRPLGDLFAVVGDPKGDGAYTVRLYFKPLVSWIWAGAVFMSLGGMVSLSDRRLRVGAPVRRRRPAGATPQPAE
jgi:cytochrome c-type biogenesis protein CcmF